MRKKQIFRTKGDDFVVLDGFHAPPIESGVGTAQASIFLDGNHTRVRSITEAGRPSLIIFHSS